MLTSSSSRKLRIDGFGGPQVTCDNAVKARGKAHADSWRLAVADPFDAAAGVSAWERLKLGGASPSPRCGVAAAARLDATYVFGGVHDLEGDGLSTRSTFFDDLYVLDAAKRRWKRRGGKDDGDDGVVADAPPPPPPPQKWDAAAVAASLAPAAPTKAAPAPPPRIGACAAVLHKVLYVGCGSLEVGDTKELGLDDFWRCDARAKTPVWTRLCDGTMAARSAAWEASESDSESDSDSSDDSDSSESEAETLVGRTAEPDEEKTERSARRRGG